MSKILTISIAACNVENYIKTALNSVVDDDIITDLEIFVIDDGGTDKTIEIAQEYADKYPNSIFCIQKANGGYGTTINYSIEHATGKYFKVLDGDDWFDKKEFKAFVQKLYNYDADIIVTPFLECYENGTSIKDDVIKGYKLNVEEQISNLKFKHNFGMWSVTFKTNVLRKSNLQLPKHCVYTDRIYSIIPFAFSKTILFTDNVVYQYRLGREDQTVSKLSKIKHLEDTIKVNDILYEFYESQKLLKNENINYILYRVAGTPREVITTYLSEGFSNQVLSNIKSYDKHLKEISPDIYHECVNISLNNKMAIYILLLRVFHYCKYVFYLGKLFYRK